MDRIKSLCKKAALPAGTFLVIISVWEAGVRITGTPLYVLPSPSKVAVAFIVEFPTLFDHSMVTLKETLIGMLAAVILGVIIAIAMDACKILQNAIYPLLVVSQTIPVIVLAPIFIIYLGFGMAPKILTVVLMCFFPVVVSLYDGMSQVDSRQVNLVRAYGASSFQVYTMIKLPASAVSLFSGLKVAATYSITGAVVGEWLSSNSGLGYYMLRVKNGYMLDKVFASILAIALLALFMNGLVRLLKYVSLPYLRKQS